VKAGGPFANKGGAFRKAPAAGGQGHVLKEFLVLRPLKKKKKGKSSKSPRGCREGGGKGKIIHTAEPFEKKGVWGGMAIRLTRVNRFLGQKAISLGVSK